MPISKSLLERIETFRRNLDSYLDPEYKEARVRQEFIDPLFTALGWDMQNESGYAEAYKDVVHEDTLRISGVGTTAPDYSFRIGGTRKFFVEAKKPSVSLKDDPEPALQLRRYSWSAKLPLGIVTDFQEFAIYDTRIRPKQGDKASVARIFYRTFDEYSTKWDEIADIFSRESVLRGSFDKYAAAKKSKRGTAEFDDDFLLDLEKWRKHVAENLALRNAALTQRDLNFAVQRILDRLIFLRIAEERGIENFGQLLALTAGPKVYPRLCEIFEKADFRYNSGLFHFEKETGRDESPDRLTLGLTLDDAVLKEIISSLYYPKSPYAFAVIPADTLGHVYEQFLGKVIHLTEGHRARVEEKPEVRKAGGVYYTPTYIVNYIVAQTVGPLVAGRSPKQVEKLRVLDPACGSGSFLLGAYEFLLDWHLKYYLEHEPGEWAKKKNPPVYETAPNASGPGNGSKNWQLTSAERKRILQNNLYGVDIDAQAVEVTKLSLLLKVLEGEARELRGKQLDFHRVLPDLGQNIKCGNSLIGSDFYAQPDLPVFDNEARYRINAFDWHHEFRSIVDDGGFDAVVGNPPYVRIQGFPREQVDYFSRNFRAAVANYDLYVNFVEKGYRLLRPRGNLGFILPNKFLKTDYGAGLRQLLAEERATSAIVDFGAEQVFTATTYTCLLFLSRARSNEFRYAKLSPSSLLAPSGHEPQSIDASKVGRDPWALDGEATDALLQNLRTQSRRLLDLPAEMSRGSSTGDDEVFVVSSKEAGALEAGALREPLYAQDFGRYSFHPTGEWKVIFPYEITDTTVRLIETARLKKDFPKTFEHLLAHRSKLEARKQTREWYAYSAARNLRLHDSAQIAVPLLANKGMFSLIPARSRGKFCPMASGGFTITVDAASGHPEFILGLLNSTLLFWVLKTMSNVFRGGWITCTKQYFGELPIKVIEPGNVSEAAMRDQIVAHVERIQKLREELTSTKSPDAQDRLGRDAAAADRAIDRLVYRLYGLTDSEIKLVETATSAPHEEAHGLGKPVAPTEQSE